jgi:cytochrome b6-f complex iron-sulfur subunit
MEAAAASVSGVRGAAPAPAGAQTRRHILAWSGWATMGLIGLQAATAFFVYFWPRKRGLFGTRVNAGSPDDYKVGDVRYFVDGKFYLTRLEEGFLALYQKCPHLGCVVPWRPDDPTMDDIEPKGRFNCPCHGSIYDRFGVIRAGPAPRPMDIMAVAIENGNVIVDTGKITQRTAYEASQAFKA